MASVYDSGLQPHQLDDLVETTLNSFVKNKWVDISTEFQEFFGHNNFLLDDKMSHADGERLQWQVKTRNTGAARVSGLYAVDDVVVADVMKSCTVPWTKSTTNFGYDHDEAAFQRTSATRIVDVIQARRHAAMTDWAELMEDLFWGLPQSQTSEELLKPYGVPYWIVRNDNEGFNGGNPITGGFTDVAGLSPTTYSQWRNYTGRYSAISRRDLVRLLRRSITKCHFKEPINHPGKAKKPRFIMATTFEILEGLTELLEEQNTNLGSDLDKFDGAVTVRRHPVYWVPYLDTYHDPTAADNNNDYGCNPIYGIDRNSFQCVFLSGKWMKRTKPITAPNQHSVRHVHFDTWMNYRCMNRRCNFVITQQKS